MRKSIKELVLVLLGALSITACSTGKKLLKENDYAYQKQVSEMMVTKRTKKHLTVPGIGIAKTDPVAFDIADLKARAKAARELKTLIKTVRAENVNNSLIAGDGEEVDIQTSEQYEATVTSQAEAILTNSETIVSYIGKANDGSGKRMAIVTIQIPLDESFSLINTQPTE